MGIPPEVETVGSAVMWVAGPAAALWAFSRIILQPILSAWLFFTLGKEPAKVKAVVEAAFEEPLAAMNRKLDGIVAVQGEQGQQLAHIIGRFEERDSRMAE